MSTCGFFGREMMDEGSRDAQPTIVDWSTASARAANLDGREVFGKHGVAEIEVARGRDGVAKSLHQMCQRLAAYVLLITHRCSCWPDAVKHVGTQRDRHDQVFWIPLEALSTTPQSLLPCLYQV